MKPKTRNPQFKLKSFLSLFLAMALFFNMSIISVPKAEASETIGRFIYVAENGNDYTGNGSSENPYRSIKKASGEATPGTTVLIRPGTYIEDDITPKTSGTEDAMIVFRPEKTSDMGKVIIKHKDIFDGSTITPQVRAQ